VYATSGAGFDQQSFQDLTVPNGTYVLKAWARASGLLWADIEVSGYAGPGSKTYAVIPGDAGAWAQYSVAPVTVTTGTIRVAIDAQAGDGPIPHLFRADDFQLIRQ
jgi:glucosylceramidase